MIKSISLYSFITALLLLASCASMKNFTHQTRQVNSFSEEELFSIQYFLSSPVTIQLKEKQRKSKITKDNEVDSKKVFYRKDLIIDEDTPGVAVKIDEDSLDIKFSDDIKLGFKQINPNKEGNFVLSSFNGQAIEKNSEVTFRDKKWNFRFGKPATMFFGLFYNEDRFKEKGVPHLLYKYNVDTEKDYEVEAVKGVEIN